MGRVVLGRFQAGSDLAFRLGSDPARAAAKLKATLAVITRRSFASAASSWLWRRS
jgi:hypothetical protein